MIKDSSLYKGEGYMATKKNGIYKLKPNHGQKLKNK